MIDTAFDIPEDPDLILNSKEYRIAQKELCDMIHSLPAAMSQYDSPFTEDVLQSVTPECVLPKLESGQEAERDARVEIAMRALVQHGEKQRWKTEWIPSIIAEDLFAELPVEQRVAVLQYVFSRRSNYLFNRYSEQFEIGRGFLVFQERLDSVEEFYRSHMRNLCMATH